jgi:hypothetical protein
MSDNLLGLCMSLCVSLSVLVCVRVTRSFVCLGVSVCALLFPFAVYGRVHSAIYRLSGSCMPA